jgi:hypothetical protein
MNQQTNFERMAMEQAAREAELDRLRLEREIEGPTQLEIAQKRIAELEMQRDQVYAEAAEWIKSLQEYFPGATGLHDVFRGIESMETKIEANASREAWINERVYYAEWFSKDGKTAHYQPDGDGCYSHDAKYKEQPIETFTESIEAAIKDAK